MPKEKPTSVSKGSGDKSERLVLDYLVKQNRPYSITDIVSNLHSTITKSECQRSLNSLVEKDVIICKLYGKQAIYVVRQDTIDTSTPEELAAIDKEVSQLQSRIEESKARSKQLTSELSALTSSLPTDQMLIKLNQLLQKNDQSRQQLSQLSTGVILVSAEEKQRVSKETEMYRRKWLERRRMFKDMFATVTENLPGKPKVLLEELGIEVDDPFDVNVNPRELVQ